MTTSEDPRDQLIRAQREEIASLREGIEELERRLEKNSRNSSKPPSSDGLVRRTKSLRGESVRASGGQPGHPGKTLKMVEASNVEPHAPEACPCCGEALSEEGQIVERGQVFDLVARRMEVKEHRVIEKRCTKCGTVSRGKFPETVRALVQYGAETNAVVTYLRVQQLIPADRTADLMSDLFECPISEGTVGRIVEEAATRLKPRAEEIDKELENSLVRCADETGVRMEKKTQWAHLLSNEQVTSYRMEGERGAVPHLCGGSLVHDGLKSYAKKLPDVRHGLCNAHHLRELKAVEEIDKEPWAAHAAEVLRASAKLSDAYPSGVPFELASDTRLRYEVETPSDSQRCHRFS